MAKRIKFFHMWNLPIQPTDEVIHSEWENISQVVLFSGSEYAYDLTCRTVSELERTVDACNHYGIPVTFLTATYTYNKNLLNWDEERYKNVTIIDWPAYWISCMAATINHHYVANCELGNDIRNPTIGLSNSIEYLYLSLNNQPKIHRCIMMDLLAKYDLVDHGAIAWRDVMRQLEGSRTEIVCESVQERIYDWKHWNPKKMSLVEGDKFETSFPDWWILPKQYSQSFMHLVPECSDQVFLISEKAAIPLLFNKLFLVAGPVNWHANAKDMGFKLYDKLFDYSFDSEANIVSRFEGIAQNINKYRDKTPTDLKQLIDSVRDKLLYNRSHAIKLAKSMPETWGNLVTSANNITQTEFLTIDQINNLDNL